MEFPVLSIYHIIQTRYSESHRTYITAIESAARLTPLSRAGARGICTQSLSLANPVAVLTFYTRTLVEPERIIVLCSGRNDVEWPTTRAQEEGSIRKFREKSLSHLRGSVSNSNSL
jgi:hypothetical protein